MNMRVSTYIINTTDKSIEEADVRGVVEFTGTIEQVKKVQEFILKSLKDCKEGE